MKTTVGELKKLMKELPDDMPIILPKMNYTIHYPGDFVEVRPQILQLSDQDKYNMEKFTNTRWVLTFLPTILHTTDKLEGG